MINLLTWAQFNCYVFYENSHQYFYYDTPVKQSVTQFIAQFFEPFDDISVSAAYAKKHGLSQEEVLNEWKRNGKISSLTGTIIHKYLEDYARGKIFEIDYSQAISLGLEDEVKFKVSHLLKQAEQFHKDTLNKLIPIQCEYTVGIRDLLAGNIDLLCWNVKANEFQIWDYKNLKEFTTYNKYGKKALKEFSNYDDCHLTHYSLQLNLYKCMLERKLNIKIGNCYLVHFSSIEDNYNIYECLDLQKECNQILDKLIKENI